MPVIGAAQSASLGCAVALAHEIGAHALEAGAVAREEFAVVQALGDQRVGQRQQHRGVGIGPDRNPFRRDRARPVVADRADIDDLDAGAASSAIQRPMACTAQPPFDTCMFFGLAPPNSTISLLCRAIDDHDVSGPVTACALPSTCGRKASAVPKL